MAAENKRPETAEDVIAAVRERDVRFIRLWFTDVLGTLKSFSINASELEDAFEGGMGFDGSSITGFNPIEESDMIAMPDPSSFALIPWRPSENATARMFADIQVPGGEPYEGDPRWILRRALQRAKDMGFDAYNIGPELEYFYFKDARPEGGVPETLDEGGYFDLTTLDAGSDVRRETILALEQLGIHVEYAHHEVGPSQHEVDMRYKDALAMSDDCMTYRIVVKEYAMKYGWHATFMPKPLFNENGSGMHVHQSLAAGGRNAFYDADDQFYLSPTAKSFIAGQLRHAREIAPLFAQWVNSYKRLVPGYEAPVYLAWSRRNRSALIRVPLYHPGKEQATQGRAALPGPRLQPVPVLRRDAPRRPRGDRARLRAARADGAEPLPPHPRRADPARDRAAARDARRGDRDRRRVRARAPRARRAHLQALHRDQARGVGGVPRSGHALGARALPAGAVAGVASRRLRRRDPVVRSVAPRRGGTQDEGKHSEGSVAVACRRPGGDGDARARGVLAAAALAASTNFTPLATSPEATGDGPAQLAAADLTGDGGLDLAIPNEDADTITILRNRPPSPATSSSHRAARRQPGTRPRLSPRATSTAMATRTW